MLIVLHAIIFSRNQPDLTGGGRNVLLFLYSSFRGIMLLPLCFNLSLLAYLFRYYIGAHIFPEVLLNDIAGSDGDPLLLSLKLAVDVLVSTNAMIRHIIMMLLGFKLTTIFIFTSVCLASSSIILVV